MRLCQTVSLEDYTVQCIIRLQAIMNVSGDITCHFRPHNRDAVPRMYAARGPGRGRCWIMDENIWGVESNLAREQRCRTARGN